MTNKNICGAIIIWCIFLIYGTGFGQTNTNNIPLGAMPMQYNPSFAGEAGAGRASTSVSYESYRSPVSGFGPGNNVNTWDIYTAYDQFLPALGTGIGVTTGYTGIRGEIMDTDGYYYSVAIAPKISIKGKYTLSPSLDFSHFSGKIDWKDPSVSFFPEEEIPTSLDFFSSKAGLLFNTNKFYIGYSLFLFNKRIHTGEKESYKSSGNYEGFKSYLQLGYTFRRSSESKFSFTPQLAIGYKTRPFYSDKFTWEGINLNFKYSQYIAGANNTGFHLGLQNEKLRLMLSASFSSRGPTGNLSFRYIFKNTDKPGGRSGF